MTLQLWERRGGTVSPLGSGHIPQGAGADGGGLGLARLKDGLLPQPCLKAPPGDSRATFRPRPHGLHELPRPPTQAALPSVSYWAGAWQGHPSASSLSSFLLPAGTCLGRERRVPGSDPDAGSAPACSTWGQSQRGPTPGSVATRPRPWWHHGWGSPRSPGSGSTPRGLAQRAGLPPR